MKAQSLLVLLCALLALSITHGKSLKKSVAPTRPASPQELQMNIKDPAANTLRRRLVADDSTSYSYSYSTAPDPDPETPEPTAAPTDPIPDPPPIPIDVPDAKLVKVVIKATMEIVMPTDFALPTEDSASWETFVTDLETGIAASLAGVTASMVEVTEIDYEEADDRRRRLTGGSLEIEFEITKEVPEEEADTFGDTLVAEIKTAVEDGSMVDDIQTADSSDVIPPGASISADSLEVEVEEESIYKKGKKFLGDLSLMEFGIIAGVLGFLGIAGVIGSCVRMQQYKTRAAAENLGKAGGEKLSLHGFDDPANQNNNL